jgi:hypothetical protein
MATLETTLAEELAETAHWSDDPPVTMEDQEFDLLAFELWHLGSTPDLVQFEDSDEEDYSVAARASCL